MTRSPGWYIAPILVACLCGHLPQCRGQGCKSKAALTYLYHTPAAETINRNCQKVLRRMPRGQNRPNPNTNSKLSCKCFLTSICEPRDLLLAPSLKSCEMAARTCRA